MNINRILLAGLGLVLATTISAAATKAPKKAKKGALPVAQVLPAAKDSGSYALGMSVGINFNQQLSTFPGEIDKDIFLKAFDAAFRGDTTLLFTAEAAQMYVNQYAMQAQAKAMEAAKTAEVKFLAENGKRPGVITTASGLQYEIIVPAEGPKPEATSKVTVHYEGTLLNGTKFDSSYDRGEPVSFPLNQVIKGWTEGVQLMSIGAKYKFYIPYSLAYGEQGAGGQIPPCSTLVFIVELKDFQKAE